LAGSAYKRVLLKISGEGLCRPGGFGLDPEEVRIIARQIRDVVRDGCEVAIVIGGGNYLRGGQFSKAAHVKRATADYMGMVATVINALALQDCLESLNVDTRVLCAIEMKDVAEPFIRRRAIRHLEKKRVVILAGGTGNPFFTTDTCAALRASELDAQVLLKATKVDGVYSDDPKTNPKAKRYTRLAYDDVVHQGLKIMDVAAITLCKDSRIPVIVFDMKKQGNIRKVVAGKPLGTRIGD
jgi:uridylate kinase